MWNFEVGKFFCEKIRKRKAWFFLTWFQLSFFVYPFILIASVKQMKAVRKLPSLRNYLLTYCNLFMELSKSWSLQRIPKMKMETMKIPIILWLLVDLLWEVCLHFSYLFTFAEFNTEFVYISDTNKDNKKAKTPGLSQFMAVLTTMQSTVEKPQTMEESDSESRWFHEFFIVLFFYIPEL